MPSSTHALDTDEYGELLQRRTCDSTGGQAKPLLFLPVQHGKITCSRKLYVEGHLLLMLQPWCPPFLPETCLLTRVRNLIQLPPKQCLHEAHVFLKCVAPPISCSVLQKDHECRGSSSRNSGSFEETTANQLCFDAWYGVRGSHFVWSVARLSTNVVQREPTMAESLSIGLLLQPLFNRYVPFHHTNPPRFNMVLLRRSPRHGWSHPDTMEHSCLQHTKDRAPAGLDTFET